MKDQTKSLHHIIEGIKEQNLLPFKGELIATKQEFFFLQGQENNKYVKPIFSDIIPSSTGTPKILLISAAGATGKTELTHSLSCQLQMPIFDLSKHKPVASDSLSGLFTKNMGFSNAATFVDRLKKGSSVLIIDALDEASLKTTSEGFDSFLDNICDIANEASGVTFILLGRTKVMEHCWLYFDSKGIDASLSLIEPFTIIQAKEFIDKNTDHVSNQHEQTYKDARDYIIDSVQAFFKSQSDIKKSEGYNHFIGYAPVLLAVSKLLDNNHNYAELLDTLRKQDYKNVDLIVSIVEQILIREKTEKVEKLVLPDLLKGRSNSFYESIKNKAYSIDEQCERILCRLLKKSHGIEISDNAQFNMAYKERLEDWEAEHPFLNNETGQLQNAVFESYVLARLMNSPKHKNIVNEYLNTRYKDAFMLFFIFDKLSADRELDVAYLPFLYSSLKSLDSQHLTSAIDIQEENSDSDVVCDVEFSMIDTSENFSFKMQVQASEFVFLGNCLSDITVDASINILLSKNRVELVAPVTLICENIKVNAGEIIIGKGRNETEGVIFECNCIESDFSNGHTWNLKNYLEKNTSSFQIIANKIPEHPFDAYYIGNESMSDVDGLLENDDLKAKYKRLRKIIVLFRSHSKGRLAKYQGKIENQRVAGLGIGKKVLEKLVQSGVLYLEGNLYFINPDKIGSQLGVSYQDVRFGKINEKTIDFLKTIG